MHTDQIEVTCVFVQDKSKGFTAFFSQLPNIIAEGDTKDEAIKNLMSAVKVVFKNLNKSEFCDSNDSNPTVTTQPVGINFTNLPVA